MSEMELDGDFSEIEPTHYAYSKYLRETFGGKTYKVVVNSGLTCPTRDGAIDTGGCAFCDVRGSSSFHGKIGRGLEIQNQINNRIPGIKARYKATRLIAYFQSYTNTYSDAAELRVMYEDALSHPEILGLAIGTRPDCLPDPVIDLLEELAQKHYVSLELGVQSFEDTTLDWLVRGHSGQCSIDAIEKMAKRAPSVHLCAHLMFGSPTDSATAPEDAAKILSQFPIKGVKLHQLMILERTKLAERFRTEPWKVLSLPEYTDQVIRFLENLRKDIYVERLAAKASHPKECIAPEWSRDFWEPHNEMKALMHARQVRQGSQRVGAFG